MDVRQLEECIQEYGAEIYAFCCQLAGNRQEAEELYQDTFLKAVEIQGRIDSRKNPRSYLASIALRIWKNKRRKYAWRSRIAGMQELKEETVADIGGQAPSPEEAVLRQELQAQVREAVARLEERYRLPIFLYYTLQLPMGQIGRSLRIPQGTVKSRLHKARKLLKQELEVIYDET